MEVRTLTRRDARTECGFSQAGHRSRLSAVTQAAAHDADLALAKSAASGDAAAIRALEPRIAKESVAAARRIDATRAFTHEVAQAVRVRLLVPDGAGHVRIADYAGRGPLDAWIGVAATRVALNMKRGAGREIAAAEVLEEVIAREPDPELRHLKSTYRGELRAALEAALWALTDRQRAILRLAYVDGLRLHQIARLYQVHESTVSRWLAQATDEVAAATRKRLIATLGVSPGTADSVARMVLSNLDLSIARILANPG
jgi:RNA polymerase sigma-70 factor (ECF subfamily)